MGTTPDRRPGPLTEDTEIRLMPNVDGPTQAGAFNFDGTSFQMRDAAGVFDPRHGSGITEEQHQHLDTLTHWIDQTSYDEVTRTGGKVTSIVTWDSIAKNYKIREEIISRVSGKVSQVVTHQYDRITGDLKETLTETYVRSNGKVVNIVRNSTWTEGFSAGVSLPESVTQREVTTTTVAGKKVYYIPLGEHFLNAASETELVYGGVTYHLGDGFYTHIHRSMATFMNVTDAMIGICLTTAPPSGITLTLRWKQRLILTQPQTLALVHCSNVGGVWVPDYTIAKWKQNDVLLAPNAIQVPPPPTGYVVEWWRLSTRKGGAHTRGSGYRSGRRYLPVFRGPAVGTENGALFLVTQFDPGSTKRPWRHYKVCYYNPTTGARSALSSEVVIASGADGPPDKLGGMGPFRYNVWINR